MLRKSKQKEAIFKVMKETDCHPTAEWVYEQARKEIPNISLGTVYRNLKLLNQEGEISKLDISGRLSRYDGNIRNHYHFICEQCGQISDIAEPVNNKLNSRLAQKIGTKVDYHHLEFYGLCPECQS